MTMSKEAKTIKLYDLLKEEQKHCKLNIEHIIDFWHFYTSAREEVYDPPSYMDIGAFLLPTLPISLRLVL